MVVSFNRVEVYNEMHVHTFQHVKFDIINSIVAFKYVLFSRHFSMHRCKATTESVVMHDEIVYADNAVVAEYFFVLDLSISIESISEIAQGTNRIMVFFIVSFSLYFCNSFDISAVSVVIIFYKRIRIVGSDTNIIKKVLEFVEILLKSCRLLGDLSHEHVLSDKSYYLL